jgi:hypothetical protein
VTTQKAHTRSRGEGSIFPYKNGRYAGYVWITTLSGERRRKYVYGATRAEVHTRWIDLHHSAARHRLATRSPQRADYLTQWLRDVVTPLAKPQTTETYTGTIARYITPYIARYAPGRSNGRRCAALAAAADQWLPVLPARQGRRPSGGPSALLRVGPLLRTATVPAHGARRACRAPLCPHRSSRLPADQPQPGRRGPARSGPAAPDDRLDRRAGQAFRSERSR